MTEITRIAYYPGCTLKTKAQNLEASALAALRTLGVEVEELPRWNCCGAVFNLADDDLIRQLAPVRNLIRAQTLGASHVVTICGQCYNVLARGNQLVREDEEKKQTLNLFMDEEPDYEGKVEVLHYLALLRDVVGWDKLKSQVKVPLEGLKVAPFYGCSLIRPGEVSINGPSEELFEDFLRAVGATPVAYSAAHECCGSYQVLAHPEEQTKRALKVVQSARAAGADSLALSCPLCEYNLGTRQGAMQAASPELARTPTYYFTQLLAVALGLEPELCHFELNGEAALTLLKEKDYIAAVPA